MTAHKKAIIALIIAHIIWGASFPIYKWAIDDVGPFTFVFFRFFFAAYLFLPFVYKNLLIQRQDIPKFIILGIIGITLNISFIFLGLVYSTSINAALILAGGPVFLLLYLILTHQKVSRRAIMGTLIALCGVLFIILKPVFEEGLDGGLLGNIFFLLASIAGIAYIILLKPIAKKYSLMLINFWTFLIGSLPVFPLVIYEMQLKPLSQIFSFSGIVGIVYGCVLAAALAHFLNAYGIKNLQTSEIGIFGYTDPLATILVAIPLVGEQITPPFIIGAILVLIGIYVTERRLHWHPMHLWSKTPPSE